ncbi:MAG: YraN family protein [Caldilineae bacterium]|nr:YraN family protein [Chloroflexota bacterium]MCB9175522.1 YraN family protein [Caldilineae bacterium]
MSQARRDLGQRGEALAASHLEALGYVILRRNWRHALGELDLVARDGDCLVLVEVRSRSGPRFGRPEESLDLRKQQRLARLSTLCVQQLGWQGPWRIDVVAIDLPPSGEPALRHYPSAVGP